MTNTLCRSCSRLLSLLLFMQILQVKGITLTRCMYMFIATGLFLTFLRKFLVWRKSGKKYHNFWKKSTTILGTNSAFFSQIGKVYLLNLDFSANLECFGLIGIFFCQLGSGRNLCTLVTTCMP